MTNLTIEQRRIVVHVRDLHGKRANSLQAGFALIGGLHGDGHELSVVTLAIEHFVRGHLTSFLVNGELGALLIGLLDN